MYKKFFLITFLTLTLSLKANFNIKFPTAGGKVFWTDIKIVNGWRIQENIWTGHCRLLNPYKVRYNWGSKQECSELLEKITLLNESKKTVILIHGLGLRKESLKSLVPLFEKEGFQTVQFGYSAMLEPLESCVDKLHSVLKDYQGDLYFVTHSMGGILLRLLQQNYGTEFTKAVLLTPPNKGAKIVDTLRKIKLDSLLGVNGKRLHTGLDSLPLSLSGISGSYITIAGTKKSPIGYFPLLFFMNEENDGVISANTTKLGNEQAHMNLAAYHSTIMKNKTVQKSILEFFQNTEK